MNSSLKTIVCQDVSTASAMLRNGQLVAFPTETVYGLGADARNPESVARIFESKQRPTFDPLIVHVTGTDSAKSITSQFPKIAEQLAAAFWPGPLTLVLPKSPIIPDLVTAGLPGVGIRIPSHPVALRLLTEAGCPVAAPSANPFSQISPTTAQHVLDGLAGRIDAVLDGGPCGIGVESTVLSLMAERPTILRPGGLPIEEIEAVVGPVERAIPDDSQENAAQPAPGMLSRHYAPRTRLLIISPDEEARPVSGHRSGLLTYGTRAEDDRFQKTVRLAESDNLRTCAAHFFAGLRSLDAENLDVIIARSFPATGLGIALNDRLRRAANR